MFVEEPPMNLYPIEARIPIKIYFQLEPLLMKILAADNF